ncbi:hypothetical protein J3Q64DRAFT_1697535 [Phycomyces blakesleeanus]|uniref:Uncharacterized protein n=2 Tax=Phycomyces blakesleeanus TaxID=4837 RepID=A0A167L372_PHYB8|nr:hypothetical protein PHYBLDRAFT_66290 [Phycomyces blakesleeanus NRRL 1555(-)]OAD69488.1 hypothetical protein PHYBLDRAFT_66290 [Phycomyces blakesleeanus NRRL 1555(-)]|eukprot:XP_018287528.1 hypothetical protein PHYBLDRAFT_66290 [Phycomyces blakesleeanus NRRL 1555(-)]
MSMSPSARANDSTSASQFMSRALDTARPSPRNSIHSVAPSEKESSHSYVYTQIRRRLCSSVWIWSQRQKIIYSIMLFRQSAGLKTSAYQDILFFLYQSIFVNICFFRLKNTLLNTHFFPVVVALHAQISTVEVLLNYLGWFIIETYIL